MAETLLNDIIDQLDSDPKPTIFNSDGSKCISIDGRCDYFNRLAKGLEYHKQIHQDKNKVMEFVGKVYKSFIDDFNHINQYHNHQIKQMMDLMINIHGFTKCKIPCKSLSRHYRDSKDEENHHDHVFIFNRNLFDTIHCFIFHSYDVGLRSLRDPFKNTRSMPFDPDRFNQNKYSFAFTI